MSYKCKYGLYHDKEVVNNEPRSNNGWIYTAYANKLDLHLDRRVIVSTYAKCYETSDTLYPIYRLPGKKHPVISRDEIIGMYSLWLSPLGPNSYFMFTPRKDYTFKDYIKAIVELYRIRNKHRNYFWEQELLTVYPIAMKLWWHDRYYIDSMRGKKFVLFNWFMFQVYALATILQDNLSAKNVLTLQLEDLNSKFWIFTIDKKANYLKYFGVEHIFNR